MWIKRKLKNWLINQLEDIPVSEKLASRRSVGTYQNGLNISVYGAEGGHVLECTTYNKQTDDRESRLYIIKDTDDFATRLSDIIIVESLRR